MKKWIIISIFIIIITGLIVFYIKNADFSSKNYNKELIEKIERLELKIDSLNNVKDSIRISIDSTHIKIITNEKRYQERINTIIVQPLSVDSQYISDYIGRYIESHKSYFQ